MSKKELDAVKDNLIERRHEIIHKLSEVQDQSKMNETDIAQDLADKAESSYTKEFLLSLSNAEREELLQIDAALKRIARGEYGLCRTCQKEIGKKRLAAIPWTPLCIECQEQSESEAT
ncbi:MAG: TraR/DksA family transcriptional regulator [Candidatus Aminicenantes bacterium]|nr:TraR/DksA family transcriptional regulator [Candidatus Aminicenantes bacterium]